MPTFFFQQNKLLSLSGMYDGDYLSAAAYKSISYLDGGHYGGYNHIVYQGLWGNRWGYSIFRAVAALVADGNGGYKYGVVDLNGGGISLE